MLAESNQNQVICKLNLFSLTPWRVGLMLNTQTKAVLQYTQRLFNDWRFSDELLVKGKMNFYSERLSASYVINA